MEFLKNKCWQELAEIAEEATRLAVEQKANQPSYKDAIVAGIKCYEIIGKPFFMSYDGNIIIKNDAGLWRCIGVQSTDKENGYIKFIKIS